jgi:hypothetical protein
MTITVSKRSKSQPKYYVYYDSEGRIESIGQSIRLDTTSAFIESDDFIVNQIVSGTESDSNYIIDLNSDDFVPTIIKKTEIGSNTDLMLIPDKAFDNWLLRVQVYQKYKKLIIECNDESIANLISMMARVQNKLQEGIVLYIINKDSPDYLIEQFEIDIGLLLKQRRLEIDIAYISKYIDLAKIGILTKRYLRHVYFEVANDDDYILPEFSNSKWKIADYRNHDPHMVITQDNNIISIKSAVTNEQLNNVGLVQQHIQFYIVGESPDYYLDKFVVDVIKLRSGIAQKFNFDFAIDNTVNIIFDVLDVLELNISRKIADDH